MKIIIDIPEMIYKGAVAGNRSSIIGIKLSQAVRNGTALPKGYGRLGDLDALEKYVIEKYSDGEQLAIDISDAPTIIEADTEVEE